MDKFTEELKYSGYEEKEVKEIIISGMLGWKRKVKRRSTEE